MKSVVIFVVVVLLVGCSTGEKPYVPDHQGWELVENDHARFFRIMKKDADRMIIVLGESGVSDTLGVYLVGEGKSGDPKPLPSIDRVVVATTTHLPFIGALGREGTVVGAVHLRNVFDGRFKELHGNGSITEVGTADGMDQELLVSLHPQVIFDHPFGKNIRSQNINDLPVIHITEYLEEHPLGRAEWLKVFGVLLNREAMADSIYAAIAERYASVLQKASGPVARPTVFFSSSWQGQWFAPPINSYMATLILDAGGNYALQDRQQGNITLDLETVLHKVRRCDHFGMILSSTGTVTPELLAAGEARLARIPALHKGGFYGNSSATDLFGQALLEPDVVLSDLNRIFHPENGDTLPPRYFWKIGQ